jgi:hypothetical protein
MPRCKKSLPTSIYWLLDVRPETLITWPNGKPFYCGKTVAPVNERLSDHKYTAIKFPRRPVSRRLAECGDFVRIHVVEVVPADGDWVESERRWIVQIRHMFPESVNVSLGGDGPAGMIHSAETRARMSAAGLGRKMPPGHGAKIAAKIRGRKMSAEQLARMSAAQRGRARTPEQRAKISATLTGRKRTAESVAKTAAANRGRTITDAHKAAISAARKGKPLSAEHRAKLSAARQGWKPTPEHAAKMAACRRGIIMSAEQREKISAAQKGRPLAAEHVAKLKAAWVRRKARKSVDNPF